MTNLSLRFSLGYYSLDKNVVKWPNFMIFVFLLFEKDLSIKETLNIPNFLQIVFGITKKMYIQI